MTERPCPRCGALEGRLHPIPVYIDASICAACGQTSSNAEWARGACWTQEEIDEMLKVRK